MVKILINTRNRFLNSKISSYRHRHKGRRTSDNESELSRGSHNSHRKHRRQRSKHRRNDSGSDNDSSRTRSFSGHRKSAGSVEVLVDSNHQWHEVQRRQAELTGGSAVQQASVMKSSLATKHQNNDTDSHSHSSSHHRSRRHKKNRSDR